MTFVDLRTAILNNAKSKELCEDYYEAKSSLDYSQLIEAGLRQPVWNYQTGVITDALLAEIPESDLNDKGIYSTGAFPLSDPIYREIYILKDANVTLDLTGRLKVIIQGAGILTANLTGSAHLEVKAYNTSSVTVTAADDASLVVNCSDESTIDITLADNTVGHVISTGFSYGTISAEDSAVAKLEASQHSALIYTQSGLSQFYNQTFHKGTINPSGV